MRKLVFMSELKSLEADDILNSELRLKQFNEFHQAIPLEGTRNLGTEDISRR